MNYPIFPYPTDMTVVKRIVSGTDEYGNDVYDETMMIDVPGCVFQPSGSSENLIFADQISITTTAYMPEGTDITAIDAVIVNGDKYEIMGEPSHWQSPFSGRVSPIRVNLSLIEGAAT